MFIASLAVPKSPPSRRLRNCTRSYFYGSLSEGAVERSETEGVSQARRFQFQIVAYAGCENSYFRRYSANVTPGVFAGLFFVQAKPSSGGKKVSAGGVAATSVRRMRWVYGRSWR